MSKTQEKTDNNILNESLSALMDGEATELELRRILKAKDEDYATLRSRWARYHASSSSIKGDELPEFNYDAFSASVSEAIDQEELHQVATETKPAGLWNGLGRFAIAASVAGAVMFGVQYLPEQPSPQIADVELPAPSSATPSHFSNGLPSDTTVRTVSSEPSKPVEQQKPEIIINEETQAQLQQAEEQLNRLILEHAQNSTQNTQQGVLPYVRVPEASED